MKYDLPKSIKRHSFWCNKIQDFANFNKCSKLCRVCKSNNLNCWETMVKRDLTLDCDVTNERNAEYSAICPKCQSDDIVGCAFNEFLCAACGAVFTLDKEQQKQCLGDNYQELDTDELDAVIKKARASIK